MPRITTAGIACAAVIAVAAVGAGCGGGDTGVAGTRPGSTTQPALAGTHTYRDPVGDVTAGVPDLTAVTIANDATTVSMRFTFRSAPPLSASAASGWTDMLLMGIDAPPTGPPPVAGGDWAGLDYALGMHGVDDRAVFRAMHPRFGEDGGRGAAPGLRTLRSLVSGRAIRIDLPRALIGDPAYFDFQAAVGREGADESGEGDLLPGTGTARYRLGPAVR